MAKPKTWREKLANDNGLPKSCEITGKMRQTWARAPWSSLLRARSMS